MASAQTENLTHGVLNLIGCDLIRLKQAVAVAATPHRQQGSADLYFSKQGFDAFQETPSSKECVLPDLALRPVRTHSAGCD